jgi:cell division protein ZapA (FtsZ GTPase activity inhibitor)
VAERNAVSVQIRGQEFRILTNDDGESLQRVAQHLNDTMALVEQQTGTVDSLDLALLSALNLARELVDIREGRVDAGAASGASAVDPERIEALIELAESALEASPA